MLDELDEAKAKVTETLHWDEYWKGQLVPAVWERVRKELAAEPGFHAAYAAARTAYESMRSAEDLKAADRSIVGHDYEEEVLREIIAAIQKAEDLLTRFLDDLR